MPVKRILPPLLLLTVGCASAPVKRTSHEEAFGRRPAVAPSKKLTKDPRSSPRLQAALFEFSDRVEAARAGVTRGQRMGSRATHGWLNVLAEVELLFMTTAPAKLSPFDLVRARTTLQTQLTFDAQLYGDIPNEVGDGAQRTIAQLSEKLAAISPVQRYVDLSRFVWPIEPAVITSPFGHRVHPISGHYRFHSGLDLLADPAQPVRAAFDGVVTFSSWNGGYGKQVELQHDPRVATRYSHLQTLMVAEGEKVKRGDLIGLAGSTGSSTGVHLHFELIRNGQPQDPEEALTKNGTSSGFPQSSSENPPNSPAHAARD